MATNLTPVKPGNYTLLNVTIDGAWIGRVERHPNPTAKVGTDYHYTAKVHRRTVGPVRDRRADAVADLVTHYSANRALFN